MSTNSDLQQINVFSKGMNTDTSDAYMSNEQYRYAENLRFITDTGENSGELRLIEGYSSVFTNLFGLAEQTRTVIAVTHIRNLLIFLTNVNSGRGLNISEVLVLNTDDGTYTIPYQSSDLWDSSNKYSLVTRWESDKNVKLYIADGDNELMSLNIKKPNGYYTSKQMLYGTSSDYLNPIECEISEEDGNIRCPVILYCYYLYTEGSGRSDLSPLSEIVTFPKLEEDLSSGKAVDILIDVRIGNFNKIRLFRIEYVKNSSVPNVYMVADVELTNSAFAYTDKGSQSYSVSYAEYKALQRLHIKPRIIESKGDYLFAANIKDVSELQNNKFKDVTVSYNIITGDSGYTYKMDRFGEFVDGEDKYGKSLMAGETYRYGFVYYTSDGQKSSVLNITDVLVPADTQYISDVNTTYTEFSRIGVSFTINNLPDDCIGYEIVRCERTIEDSNIVTQGIIGCTFGTDSGNLRYASSFMSMLDMTCRDSGKSYVEYSSDTYWLSDIKAQSDLTMFASPESSYLLDDIYDVLRTYKTGLSIQEISRYEIETHSNELSTFDAKLPLRIINDSLVYDPTASSPTVGSEINHRNQRHISFFYINPVNEMYSQSLLSGDVSEFNLIYSPTVFDDGNTIQISKDISIVDNFEFYNWDAWMYFKNGRLDTTYQPYGDQNDSNNDAYIVSSGKKCILLKSNINRITDASSTTNSMFLSVANLKRINVDPYGGLTDEAKKANTFYSYGNYFTRTSGTTNAVNVYDGDVYNCVFIYNSAHAWDSAIYATHESVVVYSVPLLTKIDLTQRTGDLWPDLLNSSYSYFLQDLKGKYGGLILDKDAYVYNTAYSLGHTANSYYMQDIKSIDSGIYDTRVFYSQPKTNGELVDNWVDYKAMDFLDVDSRYGEITGMRLFKNSLVYWLKNASGILSVNERTMLQDANDANIILGNGDVLLRFDYISTIYGMTKNQFCDTQSDNSLYWWDEDNKDLIIYSGGLQVSPMKIAKTVSNLINKSTIENPTLAYDNKYKEIIFSNVGLKSLAYNEMIQQFTSLYNIVFDSKAEMGDKLLLINNTSINKWNQKCNLIPVLKYIVNDKNTYIKVYDNVKIGMGDGFYYDAFYNGDVNTIKRDSQPLTFKFRTVGLSSEINKNITNREYDLRFAIPRNKNTTTRYNENWGERMRGRTMQCEVTSSSNSTEFSIQYIITRYRISWS